jgi:hypothetical protein
MESLHKNELIVPLTISGMMKAPEKESDHLLLSVGADCDRWIKVPLELIEGVELVRMMQCKDHSHPYVLLEFKSPTTPEGILFADIIASFQKPSPAYQVEEKMKPPFDTAITDACRRCIRYCRSIPDPFERIECLGRCPC